MELPIIPVPLVSTVSTIRKFQAGRLKSDKRKDEDQHQDFSKEQGIFQYHGIGCKKNMISRYAIKAFIKCFKRHGFHTYGQ